MYLRIGQRMTDRYGLTAVCHAGPGGCIYGRLGWAIEINQIRVESCEEALGEFRRKGFPAGEEEAKTLTTTQTGLIQKHSQERRNTLKNRNSLFGRDLDEVIGFSVAVVTRQDEAGAAQQWQEKLPDGSVKMNRCFL